MPYLENLFMLIFGHALADFVLQPDAMGYGKNRNDKIHSKEHSLFPVGGTGLPRILLYMAASFI